MWFKLDGEYKYNICVGDQIPGLDAGYYTTEVLFRDDQQRKLFQVGNYYVISDKLSDDLSFETNISQWGANREFQISDKTPTDTRTLFSNENSYIALLNDPLITDIRGEYYNDGLVVDDIFDVPRWDRNGLMKTFYRSWTKDLGVVPRYDFFFNFTFTENDNAVVFKILESEGAQGEDDIPEDAVAAVNADKRNYKITAANKWDGYYRPVANGIAGEYQPFGDSTGTVKVGHFNYKDSDNNEYALDFEITEGDADVYSVVYVENGLTYTRTGRPIDTDTTFTNAEAPPGEQSLNLTFDSYIQRTRKTYAFDVRIDVL